MESDDKIPDLRQALRRTGKGLPELFSPPEEIPPPPKDWTQHIAVKLFLCTAAIGLCVAGYFKGPDLLAFMNTYRLGTAIAIFIVVLVILIAAYVYWKSRTYGKRDDRYWKTE